MLAYTRTVSPNRLSFNENIKSAAIMCFVFSKAKQTGAGNFVRGNAGNLIISGDVDDVLVIPHIAVVDIQHLLCTENRAKDGFLIIDSAIFKVDSNILLARTVICVDVDDLAGRIEGAILKGHCGGAVRPECITTVRTVEYRVFKGSGFVAPVAGLTVDRAVFDNGLIYASEAEIIYRSGAEGHISERDRSCAIETVVAVILCAKIVRVRNFCTDVPSGCVSAPTDKGQIFPLGCSFTFNTVKCVVALAELDGVSTFGFCHSLFNCRIREVFRTIIFVIAVCRIDIDCLWACCQRRDGKHAKQHDYTQQGGKNPFFHFVLLLILLPQSPGERICGSSVGRRTSSCPSSISYYNTKLPKCNSL